MIAPVIVVSQDTHPIHIYFGVVLCWCYYIAGHPREREIDTTGVHQKEEEDDFFLPLLETFRVYKYPAPVYDPLHQVSLIVNIYLRKISFGAVGRVAGFLWDGCDVSSVRDELLR